MNRLNARIDPKLAEKVQALRRTTGQTTTAILKTAIDRYHETVEREMHPYEILVGEGFVGCAEGPAHLSIDYKAELGRSLVAKLEHSRARKQRSRRKAKTK